MDRDTLDFDRFDLEELDAQEAAFLAHQADDPHCSCPDCLTAFEARLAGAARVIDRFPDPPIAGPESTAYTFGAQILAYILAADVVVYGLLSDEELRLAHHVAGYATAGHDIDPRAATKISDTQIEISGVLARRAAELADATPTPDPQPAGPPSRPDEGPMARLQPQPLAMPPAGQRAEIEF